MFDKLKKLLNEDNNPNKKLNELDRALIDCYRNNEYEKAIPLAFEVLEISKNIHGKRHPKITPNLDNLAHLYKICGQYDEALPLYKESVEINGRYLGKSSLEYASSLNNLANFYRDTGQYKVALPLYYEVLKIRGEKLGKNHPEYATILSNLASLYRDTGQYDEALRLYLEALRIKRIQGKNPSYASSLNNLASLYKTMGQYEEALPFYSEALEIRRTKLGKTHPDYATSLNNLASLYKTMGRYDQAQPLYEESVEIWGKVLGKTHPDYALSLNNLASLYGDMGLNNKALPLYKEALDIRQRKLGKTHPSYAHTLNNLAVLYKRMGEYDKSLDLFLESKRIRENTLGKDHSSYATSLNNLASLYKTMGDYETAQQLYLEALKIRGEKLGKTHPSYAENLNKLAIIYSETGREVDAFKLMIEVFYIDINLITDVFLISSDKQRFEYLKNVNFDLDRFLSLLVGPLASDREAQKLAGEVVLRWKGLEMETSIAHNEMNLSGEYPDLKDKIQELRMLRDQQVELVLAGPEFKNLDDYQKKVGNIVKEIEALELELAIKIPRIELKKRLETINSKILSNHIPKKAVVVDFVRIFYYKKGLLDGSRYLTFITGSASEDMVLLDLGDADLIDQEVNNLRGQITGELSVEKVREADYYKDTLPEKLKLMIIDPIINVIDHVDTLYISPDGDLSLLPFEVIPYQEGFLTDYYFINYLGTARDLLRLNQKLGASRPPVVMVDPDFDYSIKEEDLEFTELPSQVLKDRTLPKFTPLPGSRLEGEGIIKYLANKNVKFFAGKSALESILKKLNSPWILHISTHGFFLSDIESTNMVKDGQTVFLGGSMKNPLIRSGLALAGANRDQIHLPEDAGDGIFTAEEASGLNLLSTDLVVLSACETGLGDVKSGEGVFGLRRAFLLAGSRTLVMSLWTVDDLATSILMERFYYNMIEMRMGKNQALKEAQKFLRTVKICDIRDDWLSLESVEIPESLKETVSRLSKQPNSNQPFKKPRFWGAFICQGDPKPLQNF